MAKDETDRRQRLLTLLLPYFGLVGLHLLVGANGYYPAIHPDEVIYREMARYFAGVGPLPNLADTFVFPIGYPLLISLLFRFLESANALGFGLLLLNSLMASAICFPVMTFARRILGVSPIHAMASALVRRRLSGLPCDHRYGSHSARLRSGVRRARGPRLAPLSSSHLTARGARRTDRGRPLRDPRASSPGDGRRHGAGALPGDHRTPAQARRRPRGGLRRRRLFRRSQPRGPRASGPLWWRGVERPLSVVLTKLLRLDGWYDVFLQICGQGWYLLLATYGLFGLGVAVLLKHLWTRRRDLVRSGPETADAHGVVFLLATAGAIFGSCAVYFPENPVMKAESEFYYFGRINEGFLALFLAAGLAVLSTDRLRTSLRAGAAVPIALAATWVLGAIMVWGRGMEPLDDPGTYGVFGTRWFVRDETWLMSPLSGTLLLAVVAFVAYHIFRHWPRLLLGVTALSFLIISLDLSIHYFGRRQQREYRRSLPQLANAAGVTSVSMDASSTRTGRWADMIRRVRVVNFDGSRNEKPSEPWVISQRRWRAANRHRARFLAGDRDGNYGLWVMPGPEQQRLYRPPDPRTVVSWRPGDLVGVGPGLLGT